MTPPLNPRGLRCGDSGAGFFHKVELNGLQHSTEDGFYAIAFYLVSRLVNTLP